MEKVLETTKSICPECKKEGKTETLEAKVVKRGNQVYLEKECEEHGHFKSLLSDDAEFYESKLEEKVTGSLNEKVKSFKPLYEEHRSQSVLTNIFVTNRCNLRCSFCFANAGAEDFVYEPEMEEIGEMLKQPRAEEPVPSKAVQITGGEPTLREDLFEIIRKADELDYTHIQLNTNGLKLAKNPNYVKKLKEAGVNTVYMSFDGVSKKTNPWIEEHKEAIENLRKAELGTVLVPTVINGKNDDELGEIVRYAKENLDVVRGANFQPVSFVGRIKNIEEEDRKQERITYSEMIGKLEEQLDGDIEKQDWKAVSFVTPISKLVEKLKGGPQVEFTAHPACGVATYAFLEEGELKPLTDFIDVEGFMKTIKRYSKKPELLEKIEGNVPNSIERLTRFADNLKTSISLLGEAPRYIDEEKAPKNLNIKELALNAVLKGDYDALGEFHEKGLFLGSMWFQDPWNISSERLRRCVIHYSTPEGIVPFCAYNGLGVGHEIRERHSIPIDKWEEKTGKKLEDDLYID